MPAVLASATTGKLGVPHKKGSLSDTNKASLVEANGSASILPGPSRFSRKRIVDDKLLDQAQGTSGLNAYGDVMTSQDFCQRLLIEGFVQSYVDFYHLTHRANPDAREAVEMGEQIVVSVAAMTFLRDTLTQAERAKRAGDTLNVYLSFTRLAEHYAGLRDNATSIFFYEKCLDIATLTSDIRAEMTANHSLGTVYQTMGGKDEMARKCHERHAELAESVDAADEVMKSSAELYKVYTSLAGTQYDAGLADSALELYNLALSAAKKSWNKAAEAEANGKIGTLLLQRGEAAGSIPYLRSQSQIAADNGNAESRCRACSCLALAYDSLGKSEQALGELTLVSSISEQAGDALLQAQACRALGTLYSKVGLLAEAMDALQRYFNLLKQILSKQAKDAAAVPPDTSSHVNMPQPITLKDIELARAYVGVAKGNIMMGSYVVAIQHDFNSVLGWKLNRSAIAAPVVAVPEKAETEKRGAEEDEGAVPPVEEAIGEASEAKEEGKNE